MINSRTITINIRTLPVEDAAFSQLPRASGNETSDRLKTALNGDFGRILCIGYCDEQPGARPAANVLGWNTETENFTLDEPRTLTEFWRLIGDFNPQRDRIVGHNIFDFDLRFILKRSRRFGIKPSVNLSFARYRNLPIYDLMCEWECWAFGSKVSFDRLTRIFSLPASKTEEISGLRLFELFEMGWHREIRDYCLRDVKLARAIYRRMTFVDAVVEPSETGKGGERTAELSLPA